MDQQGPEKKQRGRVNNFMVLAGGYLLYLAYTLVRDAGESSNTVLCILAAVLFAAVGGAVLWREWKAYRYGLEHKDDPESWSEEPEEPAEEEEEES